MQRIGGGARAAGLVEPLGEVGRPHVTRIGPAQPQAVDDVPAGAALVRPDPARTGVVGPAAGQVELDHLHERRIGDQRDAGFAVEFLGLQRTLDVGDLGELDADRVGAVAGGEAAQSRGDGLGAAIARDRMVAGLVALRVGGVFDQLQDAFPAEGAPERGRDGARPPAVEQLAVQGQLGHVLVHRGDVHLGLLGGVAEHVGREAGARVVDRRGDRQARTLARDEGVRSRRGVAGAEQIDRCAALERIGRQRGAADDVAGPVLHRVRGGVHVQHVRADLVHPPGVVPVLVVAIDVPVVEEPGVLDVPFEAGGGAVHHAGVADGVGAAEIRRTARPPQDE